MKTSENLLKITLLRVPRNHTPGELKRLAQIEFSDKLSSAEVGEVFQMIMRLACPTLSVLRPSILTLHRAKAENVSPLIALADVSKRQLSSFRRLILGLAAVQPQMKVIDRTETLRIRERDKRKEP